MQTIPKHLIQISRTLRKNQTPWEAKLWYYLRANRMQGIQFKRQVRLGSFIVDFYCASKKLVIELDGAQHDEVENRARDQEKEFYLKNQRLQVLRFWNNDIDQNLEGVLENIREALL